MSNDAAVPAQRWFQFSLRSTLLLMFLVAGLFAWYANGMSRYRAIVEATNQLKKRDAIVEWHLQSWPRFDEVTRISLRSTRPTSSDLAVLGTLTDVAWLSLARTPIRDEDLSFLAGLENLAELDLSDTQIGDDGLVHLLGLRNLSVLKIGNTRVTEAGIARVRQALPGIDVRQTSTTVTN